MFYWKETSLSTLYLTTKLREIVDAKKNIFKDNGMGIKFYGKFFQSSSGHDFWLYIKNCSLSS